LTVSTLQSSVVQQS